MAKKQNLLEKLQSSFENKNELLLSVKEKQQHERLLFVLEQKMFNIGITDADMHLAIKDKYGNDYTVSYVQTCKDVTIIERFIAHDVNPEADPHKTWVRYMVEQMCKKAYNIALKKGESYNMTMAANTIGKHHLTDKEDVVKPPFDDIIPFVPEITGDVSVLGIKPIGKQEVKELRTKLLTKYGANELLEIEDLKVIDDEAEK